MRIRVFAEEEAVDLAVETGKQVVYAAAPGWVEFGTLFFKGFDDFCERWRAQREYFGFAGIRVTCLSLMFALSARFWVVQPKLFKSATRGADNGFATKKSVSHTQTGIFLSHCAHSIRP